MYQYAAAQSLADEAAELGSIYWTSQDINDSLYWRIYDNNYENKCSYIKKYIENKLKKSILSADIEARVFTENKFLQKNLCIEIDQKYPFPVGKLLSVFGLKPTFTMRTTATSCLNDNPEFIRNMDMVADIGSCLLNSDNKWIGEGTKANEIIDKLIKNNK